MIKGLNGGLWAGSAVLATGIIMGDALTDPLSPKFPVLLLTLLIFSGWLMLTWGLGTLISRVFVRTQN